MRGKQALIGIRLEEQVKETLIRIAPQEGRSLGELVGEAIAEWLKMRHPSPPVKVVPGAGVEVVTTGWEFSRDFANMFLILILVFIGLAIILKLKEYEAKRQSCQYHFSQILAC